MTASTWRSERIRSTALLLLALAITTGWTQAAPTHRDVTSRGSAAQSTAAGHQLANVPQPPISSSLATYRAFQAALALSARTLFQVRVVGARAVAPAPMVPVVKAPARVEAPAGKAGLETPVGTNHFWFPALGMSRTVRSFPCSRTRAPENYVYRWGCAGTNNVYLMGHAYGVFKPLHDAYFAGRLRVGMVAYYADANGRVRKYVVTTWRVVDATSSSWAIASQSVPSLTLQTCVHQKRLNVRLVAAN